MSDLQQTVADLAARLERLEIVQAIERLKYRYWRACDAKDPDTFRDCFVKQGADIDYGPGLGAFHDREPLVEVFARLARRRPAAGGSRLGADRRLLAARSGSAGVPRVRGAAPLPGAARPDGR